MTKITKERFAKACMDSGGVISVITKRLGVSRQAVFKFKKRFPEVQQDIEDSKDALIDLAENQIHNAINNGDIKASMYLLDRVGKSRGYTTKQEIEHTGVMQVVAEVTPEQLRERIEKIRNKRKECDNANNNR